MDNLNPHEIQTCNKTAQAYGEEIAKALRLKKVNLSGRGEFYDTDWGFKTDVGLARIVHTIITKPFVR